MTFRSQLADHLHFCTGAARIILSSREWPSPEQVGEVRARDQQTGQRSEISEVPTGIPPTLVSDNQTVRRSRCSLPVLLFPFADHSRRSTAL